MKPKTKKNQNLLKISLEIDSADYQVQERSGSNTHRKYQRPIINQNILKRLAQTTKVLDQITKQDYSQQTNFQNLQTGFILSKKYEEEFFPKQSREDPKENTSIIANTLDNPYVNTNGNLNTGNNLILSYQNQKRTLSNRQENKATSPRNNPLVY